MPYRNGGDLLVEVLRAAGVDTAFGVVSIHNLPLVQAVSAALRFVPVRHEAAAVNAADGYARARGGPGCAITSTGTGAGNAAGSLVEALTAGSPVLHVTGQIPTGYLGQGRGFIHETRDQAGMLAAVSKAAYTVQNADAAADLLPRAIGQARTAPGGPVSVEWPIDLQYAPVTATAAAITSPGVAAPEPGVVAEAAALLAAARRPAIWAGGGASRAGARLGELTGRLGAALFTSNAGRGAVPEDHPLCVGNYATAPAGQALLDDADVLLSLGTHFRSNETHTYQLRLPATHVQVDIDPAALGRAYPVKLGVCGDADAFLAALLAALEPATDPGWPARVREARARARAAQRQAIGAQAAVCDAIRAALPRDGIIARDVTIPASSWGNRLLSVYDPRSNLFARGGGIGQGLAMGLGAAAARPATPVVVIAGDGGLAVHLGELLTLAQERPRLTLIVFNDGGYGVLRNMQDAQGQPRAGVDLLAPDFAALAAAARLGYARLDDPAAAHDVVGSAVAAGRPTLVEVDVVALGPMPELFVPPVQVPDAVEEVGCW
ncbi:MAG: thiamine pyrophosphate-binding protein [Streptosporangiaceae bacterium]